MTSAGCLRRCWYWSAMMAFPADSDNIHYMVLKWGTLPFLFLWFCSSRVPMARYGRQFEANGLAR